MFLGLSVYFIILLVVVTVYCYFLIYLDQVVVPLGILLFFYVLVGSYGGSAILGALVGLVFAIGAGITYYYYSFYKKETKLEMFMAVQFSLYIFAFVGLNFAFFLLEKQVVPWKGEFYDQLLTIVKSYNVVDVINSRGIGSTVIIFGVDMYLKYNWKKKQLEKLGLANAEANTIRTKSGSTARNVQAEALSEEDIARQKAFREKAKAPASFKKRKRNKKS